MIIKIFTWLYGQYVGKDPWGNRYYQSRRSNQKRWVLYQGKDEPSKVPPLYHAWLHQTVDTFPHDASISEDFLPNGTGTLHSYESSRSRRATMTALFQCWTPRRKKTKIG